MLHVEETHRGIVVHHASIEKRLQHYSNRRKNWTNRNGRLSSCLHFCHHYHITHSHFLRTACAAGECTRFRQDPMLCQAGDNG